MNNIQISWAVWAVSCTGSRGTSHVYNLRETERLNVGLLALNDLIHDMLHEHLLTHKVGLLYLMW